MAYCRRDGNPIAGYSQVIQCAIIDGNNFLSSKRHPNWKKNMADKAYESQTWLMISMKRRPFTRLNKTATTEYDLLLQQYVI